MNQYNKVIILLTVLNVIKAQVDPIPDIKLITVKIVALDAPINSINLINGPLIIVGLGPYPTIIGGLADINQTYSAFTGRLVENFYNNSATGVQDAYDAQFQALNTTLNNLKAKAGLFQTVPIIGLPITSVLRPLKVSFDANIDTAVVDLQTVVESKMTSGKSSVDTSFDNAITAYEGLSL